MNDHDEPGPEDDGPFLDVEIKPCPFCGSDAKEHATGEEVWDSTGQYMQVDCGVCHASWPRLYRHKLEGKLSEDATDEQVEALLIAHFDQRAPVVEPVPEPVVLPDGFTPWDAQDNSKSPIKDKRTIVTTIWDDGYEDTDSKYTDDFIWTLTAANNIIGYRIDEAFGEDAE